VIKQELIGNEPGPSEDDLMAIADAVREVAKRSDEDSQIPSDGNIQTPIGRRGHLRAVPS
jgi:hypothetical protein